MRKKITLAQFQETFAEVFIEVENGDSFDVMRDGQIIATLVPKNHPLRLKGILEGVAFTRGKPEDLYSTGEKWNAM